MSRLPVEEQTTVNKQQRMRFVKMADNCKEDTWILYYWPKLAGRAEFIRVIFEEAGVAFKEINDLDVLVPMFRQGKVTKFHTEPKGTPLPTSKVPR